MLVLQWHVLFSFLSRCGGLPQFIRERPFRLEAARAIHSDYHGVVLQARNRYDNDVVRGLAEVREESISFNKNTFNSIFFTEREYL